MSAQEALSTAQLQRDLLESEREGLRIALARVHSCSSLPPAAASGPAPAPCLWPLLPGPSGHPRGSQTHPGQWAPSPPPPSAGLTCSSVRPSLGHPITSPGLTLGLQRPHHCGAPSSTPQLLLAHLHSTGLTPPWAPAALPGERSAHDSESPSLAPLLG